MVEFPLRKRHLIGAFLGSALGTAIGLHMSWTTDAATGFEILLGSIAVWAIGGFTIAAVPDLLKAIR